MPQISIYAAYSAGATIATRVEVPDVVPANKIKALAGHEKTASVFAWLGRHPVDRKCACYVCKSTRKDYDPFKRASWMQAAPARPYVRFDIGARNVRFNLRGGECFVVVAECDVDAWLATLPATAGERLGNARLGLLMALPLVMERTAAKKSRREVAA